MSVEVLTFEMALDECRDAGIEPHLLLGNGFSISCRPGVFNYGALLENATFADACGDVRAVFGLLGTTDFERVIEVLRLAAALADQYGPGSDLGDTFRADADVIAETLATTLAARHPNLPTDIGQSEYQAVRTFLAPFRRIYTLNYDMLLYWAAMQSELQPNMKTNDGFGEGDNPDASYVVWEPYLSFSDQRLFFLHGALHLYDSGSELSKITWSRTGIPLVDQIRQALDEARYPLIVTEGSSAEKETKILHNAYLTHAIRSFAKIQKILFIHGHSLAESDDHILRRIVEGKLDRVYISLYGDVDGEANRGVISRGRQLTKRRAAANPRRPLAVEFYDAESAHVWR